MWLRGQIKCNKLQCMYFEVGTLFRNQLYFFTCQSAPTILVTLKKIRSRIWVAKSRVQKTGSLLFKKRKICRWNQPFTTWRWLIEYFTRRQVYEMRILHQKLFYSIVYSSWEVLYVPFEGRQMQENCANTLLQTYLCMPFKQIIDYFWDLYSILFIRQ